MSTLNLKLNEESENQFKHGRELLRVERLTNKLNRIFFKLLPNLYSLIYCENSEYVDLRGLVSFIIGTLYAIIIWYLTVFRIEELSDSIKKFLLLFKITVVSISMTSLYKCRCVMTLATFKFVIKELKLF